jgi:hypothetical protein
MSRLLAWIALNLAASAFVLANRSEILMAKGSDALVSIYRVSGPGQAAALVLFALVAGIALFPARLRVLPGGARIRAAAGSAGLACMLAAGHGVIVGTRNDRVELRETLGPLPIRTFAAEGPEDRLSSRCDGLFLTVAPSAAPEGRILLGLGPWRLPAALCRHPLLQPAAPAPVPEAAIIIFLPGSREEDLASSRAAFPNVFPE